MNVIIYTPPAWVANLYEQAYEHVIPWDVAIETACRLGAAAELRAMAARYEAGADRRRADRTFQIVFRTTARLLNERANELDPEGAQR